MYNEHIFQVQLVNSSGGVLDIITTDTAYEGDTYHFDQQRVIHEALRQAIKEWILEPGDTIKIVEFTT